MSLKLVALGVATVTTVALLFAGAGAVAAHDTGHTVGASGNCDDGDNGGGGSVGVSENGSYDGTNASEAQSTAEGLLHYFEQRQNSENDPCDDHRSDYDSYDYLEVHASDVQYCYSENNSQSNGNYSTDGSDACHG